MISRSIKKLLPKRIADSNKGTYGKVLNIAGSKNYTGAAYLSSLSALKVGAGYVSLASSEYVCSTVSHLTPYVTFCPLNNLDDLQKVIGDYNVLSVGCGLSVSNDAVKIFEFVFNYAKENNTQTVIDADGLNILAQMKIEDLGKNFILTPHPKELSRLLEVDVNEIQKDRSHYVNLASDKYNCTVVLKGCNTVVSDGENLFVNKTGNSALAKAGTGDVLCGMIAGFLAQGCDNFSAAKLAVYLHGLCADKYAKENSPYSMLALDLLDYLPKILKKF